MFGTEDPAADVRVSAIGMLSSCSRQGHGLRATPGKQRMSSTGNCLVAKPCISCMSAKFPLPHFQNYHLGYFLFICYVEKLNFYQPSLEARDNVF